MGEAAEIIIAAFTIVLAIATAVLAWATWKLWQATNLLASKTGEDFTRHKVQETVVAWERIRELIPSGGLPQLDKNSRLPEDLRSIFRKIEYFSACVNSGVYDLHTFGRLSGSWFLQQYDRVAGYVETRHNPLVYTDLKQLHAAVERIGPGGGIASSDGDKG